MFRSNAVYTDILLSQSNMLSRSLIIKQPAFCKVPKIASPISFSKVPALTKTAVEAVSNLTSLSLPS